MRLSPIIVTMLLSGCAPAAWQLAPGLPGDLAREDPGTITGAWQEVTREGRPVRNGYSLSIGYPHPYTFAARKGCVATGGVLVPLGGDRFRIDRYESGYATEGCGVWRPGPEVAPFDGSEVLLSRHSLRLSAMGGGRTVELRRLMLRVG
nr:hypothetical protein [uncultured Sphingosinicella sp.]